MRIIIYDILGTQYDAGTILNKPLGGSESAVISISDQLSKIGFSVTVVNNSPHDDVYISSEGVRYIPLKKLSAFKETFDIAISSRSVIPFAPENDLEYANSLLETFYPHDSLPIKAEEFYQIAHTAKHKAVWMHDTFCAGDERLEEYVVSGHINEIFVLSDWHLSYVLNAPYNGNFRNYEVLKRNTFITRNGMNPHIDFVDISKKDKNLFVYNASVSKGMVPLVSKLWPMIKSQIPDAKLTVIGGFYDFSGDGKSDEQKETFDLLRDSESNSGLDITFTGIIKQKEVAEIMAKASYNLYPAIYPETYGISTLESLYYGTPLISTRFGALEETALEDVSYLIDYAVEPNYLCKHVNEEQQLEALAKLAVSVYNNPRIHQHHQHMARKVKDICTWDTVALQWKQHFYRVLQRHLPKNEFQKVTNINDRVHQIFSRRTMNYEEHVSRKNNLQNRIVVVTPVYNSENYIAKCIESVACQDYENYMHIIIDDRSTDNTLQVAIDKVNSLPPEIYDNYLVLSSNENFGALKNQISAIRDCNEDTIVVLLDGDDWLYYRNDIFSYINNLYLNGAEFTYGSSWSLADNIPLVAQEYPEHVKKERSYRKYEFDWGLPYTHLRTFRAELLKDVDDSEFMDDNGEWFRAGGDNALFYAAIENASPSGIVNVLDILYVYNDLNPLNDFRVNGDEQNATAKKIRNRKDNKMTVNFKQEYVNACKTASDINEHLPYLKSLASECESVTEFGVREGNSTRAFLASSIKKLTCYDLYQSGTVSRLFSEPSDRDLKYLLGDTREIDIEETDLLFIDTLHTFEQLSIELAKHSNKVRKYIVLHDVYTYGCIGESEGDHKGLLYAVSDFLKNNSEWSIKKFTTENNGLMVLERVSTNFSKKKILIALPTNKYVETETMKSVYDQEIPEGYETELQFFFGYRIDQIRNLIADWGMRYDYLFCVDSDIVLPKDALKRLVESDHDIVCGIYRQRRDNQVLEVFKDSANGADNIHIDEIDFSIKHQEIAACGAGCLLIRSEVLRNMEYPHFDYSPSLDHEKTLSEDVYFCLKARDLGYRIIMDASLICRHVGNTFFDVTEMSRYSVIIPTMWKAPELFEKALQSYASNVLVNEVIIVNNAVEKTPYWEVLKHWKVKMLDQAENIFVNPAWNLGVSYSSEDLLCIANDDVVVDSNVFSRLKSEVTPETGVYGLNAGIKELNQPEITDGSIQLYEWRPSDHIHCFGQFMVLHRNNWVDIPEGMKISMGDDFIFHNQLVNGRKNYMICNCFFESVESERDGYRYYGGATSTDEDIVSGTWDNDMKVYLDWVKENPAPNHYQINHLYSH